MPAINFQKQFSIAVESGAKRQTIRKRRKRPFRAGDTLYLYTGMRTKYCKKLRTEICQSALDIDIAPSGIILNGDELYGKAADDIAVMDGFQSFGEMLQWLEAHHGLPFRNGQLITW